MPIIAAAAAATTTTTPVLWPLFQDNLVKPVTEKVKPVWI